MGIMQALMGSYSSASGISLTHVGASYQREDGGVSFTQTFTPPSGAQAGDVLVLSTYQDRPSSTITSGPSGWTLVGSHSGNPNPVQYYQIYNGSDTSWSITRADDNTTMGSVVAFRPNQSISTVTSEQFQSASGDNETIANTISSVTTTNAPGGRIYFYSSSGVEDNNDLFSVSTTFSPSTDWTTVSGQSAVTGDGPNYAYRLAEEGDAFVSTTASGTSSDKFGQALFILNVE